MADADRDLSAIRVMMDRAGLVWERRTFRGNVDQRHVKLLLVAVWRLLHPQSRRSFLDSLDERLMPVAQKGISDREREELLVAEMLRDWPSVLSTVSKDDRGFAMSIMKNRSSAGWWPTDAQIGRMKGLWAERSVSSPEEDIDLLEDAE